MGYAIMVDMDQTLIESVFEGDARYGHSNGKIISYDTLSEMDGINISQNHLIKVAVRPMAIEMVKAIVNSGHQYILWSAGTYDYVNAVMNYFISISGVSPSVIYTRGDMVNFGNSKYKSMRSKGYSLEDFIILEDNPKLVHPFERDRIVKVVPWEFEKRDDMEMLWVTQLFQAYGMNKTRPLRLVEA